LPAAYISRTKEKGMGKIESTIKSEIQRLAKREIKSTFLPLRREVRNVRLKLSSLSKNFRALDRLAKEQIIPMTSEKFKLEASPEEVKVARLTAARIRNLRKKLGISQRELAVLTGASMGTVVMWEKGKFKPKADKRGALIALRKLGKRQVKRILAEKAGSKKPKTKIVRRRGKRNSRKGVSRRKVVRRARRAKR
jgi:DNA-binding transcriptional regulator YiaG